MASFKANPFPARLRFVGGLSRGTASVNRTKENEGLSVSNSQRFCTYLQHPGIRPSLGIMVSFSLNLTYPGGSTWLPCITQPIRKRAKPQNLRLFPLSVGHSTSSLKCFSPLGSTPFSVSEAPETPALSSAVIAHARNLSCFCPEQWTQGLIECLSPQLCRFERGGNLPVPSRLPWPSSW